MERLNYTPLDFKQKKKVSSNNIVLISILSLIFVSSLVMVFFVTKIIRTKSTVKSSSNISINTIKTLNKSKQTLERNPTKEVLTKEYFVNVNGETDFQGNRNVGFITEGTAMKPLVEDRKRLEEIKNNPKAQASLFSLEARDLNNKVLSEHPISVGEILPGDDVVRPNYQKTGSFFEYLLLPINTNSLVLKERTGEILDRVYVEDWEPEVIISNYPESVSSTDKFKITVELLPPGKAYSYSLILKNAKSGMSQGSLGGQLKSKSGKFIEELNLNNYPFTTTDQWIIEANGSSLFHTKSTQSKPITINISSKNITVEISGKDKNTRKTGDNDYLMWNYVFYGIDVTRGLKELCAKGRCFELTWTGEGVQFNEKYWELKPVDSVTTQITSLNCSFKGSGRQTIHLQVTENGKVIGNDTYSYNVVGKGNENEKTLCTVNDY